MAYFNGGLHGWNDRNGYHAPAPCTAVYCDACAHGGAVPMDHSRERGQEHHGSDFKWAPYYGGGRACDKCGGSVDHWRRVARDEIREIGDLCVAEKRVANGCTMLELVRRYGEGNVMHVPGVGFFKGRAPAN